MRSLHSSFSLRVLLLRVAGAAMVVAGLVSMLVAWNLTAIAVAVAGSLVWQAGTLLKERSSLFRRLETTPIRDVMRSRLVPVAIWWSLEKVRALFPLVDNHSFFVTTESGFLTGIALPEWIWEPTHEEARHRKMEELSRPIEYVHAVRDDATALMAFGHMNLLQRDYLSVTDARDTLVGVITREQVTAPTDDRDASQEVAAPRLQSKGTASGASRKIAA